MSCCKRTSLDIENGYGLYYSIGEEVVDKSSFDHSASEGDMDESSYDFLDDFSWDDLISEKDAKNELEKGPPTDRPSTVEPNWSELPPPALENIFLRLEREDRCKMSAVCKNWFREYTSNPTIWRSATFNTSSNRMYSTGLSPGVLYARNYGHMFHHVRVTCSIFNEKQLKLLLKTLTANSQLQSLSFIMLDYSCDTFRGILNLLLAQAELKSLRFWKAWFKRASASEMFRLICVKHFATLKTLVMEDFVLESSKDHFGYSIDAASTFNLFMNLRVVCICYSQMFESVIMACFKCAHSVNPKQRKGALETMKLSCYDSENIRYDGIPAAAWKCLAEVWPAMKIDLLCYALTYCPVVNNMHKFIVPYMPIRSFIFEDDLQGPGRNANDLRSVLSHIVSCKVEACLEELTITLMQSRKKLAADLINFLGICLQLRKFELYVHHPLEGLDTVFKSWLDSGTKSLERVHITIANVPKKAKSKYLILADDYSPLLKVRGLKLSLKVEEFQRID